MPLNPTLNQFNPVHFKIYFNIFTITFMSRSCKMISRNSLLILIMVTLSVTPTHSSANFFQVPGSLQFSKEGKVIPVSKHHTCLWNGDKAPHSFNLRWVVSFTLRPLSPWWKNRRLCGSQSQAGCGGKENHCPYQEWVPFCINSKLLLAG